MKTGLNLTNLPEQFEFVSGDTKQATIAYKGLKQKLNGVEGVFNEAMDATGAAKVHVHRSENDLGHILLDVYECR